MEGAPAPSVALNAFLFLCVNALRGNLCLFLPLSENKK